jgi:predicted transcriptional regulator
MQSTTSLKLDSEIKERIKRLALSRKRSAHWVMREAIEQYIHREEQHEQTKSAVMSAWEDYQSTGLHVSSTQADAWLAQLEAGEEADMPECQH